MLLVLFPLPPWYRKRCSRCGAEKAFDDFYLRPSTRDGLTGYCRRCKIANATANNTANPAAVRQRRRRWKKRHPDKVKVQRQRQHARNYPQHAHQRRAVTKAYRDANPEKVAAWWTSPHGRMVRRINQGRRRTRLAAAPATLTRAQWETIVTAFGGLCAYCGQPWEEIDHIVPVSAGGGFVAGNVVPACGGCNVSKHARPFDDFCRSKGIDSMAMAWIIRRAGAAGA